MDTTTDAAIQHVLAAQQATTHSKIAFSVAAKALRSQEAAGDAAIALIEAAGQISDRVGRAPGKGLRIDLVR